VVVEDDKTMTVQEAGKKGGDRTKVTKDREYFRRIGRMGGRATASKGKAHMVALATQGGLANRDKHGRRHMQEIARLGGEATKEKYDPNGQTGYYEVLNEAAVAAKRAKKRQKK